MTNNADGPNAQNRPTLRPGRGTQIWNWRTCIYCNGFQRTHEWPADSLLLAINNLISSSFMTIMTTSTKLWFALDKYYYLQKLCTELDGFHLTTQNWTESKSVHRIGRNSIIEYKNFTYFIIFIVKVPGPISQNEDIY